MDQGSKNSIWLMVDLNSESWWPIAFKNKTCVRLYCAIYAKNVLSKKLEEAFKKDTDPRLESLIKEARTLNTEKHWLKVYKYCVENDKWKLYKEDLMLPSYKETFCIPLLLGGEVLPNVEPERIGEALI